MPAKPPIEELDNASVYEKILTLSYNDLAPFVIKNIKSFSYPMLLIWLTLLLSAFLTVYFWPGLRYPADNQRIITGLMAGLLLVPLLIVPVHEALHLLPFRLGGAKDIRFGADIRQGIIYVTAHRFVADRRLFSLVALTPFIVITTGLIIMIFYYSPWWKWIMSMALLTHTTMCAGDAALLGFMSRFRRRNVYTWDDAEKKEAYFYAESVCNKNL